MLAYFQSSNQGRFYVGQGVTCHPPQIHLLSPQIQKLADRSHMILRSQNAPKSKFSWAPSRTPLRKLTVLPQTHNLWGGAHCPPPRTSARCRPFWPRFYGSQGPTCYRVDNHTNDRFQYEVHIFSVLENGENVLGYEAPLQNFWARTAPASNILTIATSPDLHLDLDLDVIMWWM